MSDSAVRVLLVDDQAMIGEAVRRMLMNEPDIEYRFCGDPAQAMAVAAEFRPTVILQDLVMPDIDGLTMLRYYRANPATRSVPAIVLSTKEEPKVKAEAFQLGASDYLVKLPDPVELVARLRLHSRGYVAQLQRDAAYAALQSSEQRLADELAEAAKYLMSLLPARVREPLRCEWAFIPSAELGGDTLGYSWLDKDHFVVYVLDVCGHGLKAALLSISAINVLRNQTLPNTDFRQPAAVLAAMNDAFQMDRHDDMYFTLWYGVVDVRTRTLTHASAGHPPALLLGGATAEAATVQELGSLGMIVGGFPGVTYQEEAVALPPYARLLVFSDGVFEITRPDESMTTLADFTAIVQSAPRADSAVEHIVTQIRGLRGQDTFEDDVSLVEISF
jgi:sigma-B regulation protein RsbU (phosphoserine phosphatase)